MASQLQQVHIGGRQLPHRLRGKENIDVELEKVIIRCDKKPDPSIKFQRPG
jgi:hypothetical protein